MPYPYISRLLRTLRLYRLSFVLFGEILFAPFASLRLHSGMPLRLNHSSSSVSSVCGRDESRPTLRSLRPFDSAQRMPLRLIFVP